MQQVNYYIHGGKIEISMYKKKKLKYAIKVMVFYLFIYHGFIYCNVNALNQNQLSIHAEWIEIPYFQGDGAEIVLEVTSFSDNDLRIKEVEIVFEWYETQERYSVFMGEIRVPGGLQQVQFNKTIIKIPNDAPIGWSDFEVIISGEERGFYGWSSFSWQTSDSLLIHNVMEKIYSGLIKEFNETFELVQTIESIDSLSLLTQAQNDAELSQSFARSGKWDQAVSMINSGINKLVEVTAEEEKFQIEKSRTGVWIFVIDQAGEPISDVVVEAISPSPNPIQGYTDNDGVAIFDSIEPGSYFFTVNDNHYTSSPSFVAVELGKISKLLLHTQQIGNLTVIVKKTSGNPLEGAYIQTTSTSNGTKQLSGYTDASGGIFFVDINVGHYVFEASMEGYQIESKEIVVSNTQTILEFELKKNWIPGFSLVSMITAFCVFYLLIVRGTHVEKN